MSITTIVSKAYEGIALQMIKTEASFTQLIRQDNEVEITAERRESLARKGQVLYGKYCGTGGRGICAESFAEYHIWRGEYIVARDFLIFLSGQVATLNQTSPKTADAQELLAMTYKLINRIETLLGEPVIEAEPAGISE